MVLSIMEKNLLYLKSEWFYPFMEKKPVTFVSNFRGFVPGL